MARKTDKQRQATIIRFSLNPKLAREQKQLVMSAARMKDVSLAEFIRKAVLNEAMRITGKTVERDA